MPEWGMMVVCSLKIVLVVAIRGLITLTPIANPNY